jgi:hypothetical protein
MVERRDYQEKFADFFCCHCGVAVLRCLARNDLLAGVDRRIEVDDRSLAVGNIGCGCAECGYDETDIITAYERRILLLNPSADNEAGNESDRPSKKTKIDPAEETADAADAADTAAIRQNDKTKATGSVGSAAAAAVDVDDS